MRGFEPATASLAFNGTTRFLWGGASDWQCLEERDGDDDLVARFTDDSGGVVERYRYGVYCGCTVLDAGGSAGADGLSDVGGPCPKPAR